MPRPSLLAVSVLSLVGCDRAPAPPAAAPVDRAQRVLVGLRPKIEVAGAPVRYSLAERMAYYKVPGVSIAIIDSGRVVWARGFGVKVAGGQDSVTPTTTFQAASISKAVTATATLRLVDQGKLDLDRPINEYLKSWHLPDNRFTANEKVTLRRILSHSAGLTVHGFPGYEVGAPLPTVPQILDGAKPANTLAVRVDTFPGARWQYSGGGTTIEQLILMDVTGQPFPDLIKSLVLDPLGMSNSAYDQPPAGSRIQQASHGHDPMGAELKGGWHIYPELGPAGLWTTPSDLGTWALGITAARDGRDSKLFSAATAKAMLTVQSGSVGLGPFVEDSGRALRFGHGGDNAGFHSNLWMIPGTGQGAAVMTNGDGGTPLISEIMYAIAVEYGWPDYAPTTIHPVKLDPATIAAAAGSYEAVYEKRKLPFTITASGDTLGAGTPFTKPERLIPESATRFWGSETGFRYELILDPSHRVTGATILVAPGFEIPGRKLSGPKAK